MPVKYFCKNIFLLPLIFFLTATTPFKLWARKAGERAAVSVDEINRPSRDKNQKKKGPEKFNKAVTLESNVELKLIKGISQTVGFLKKTANSMRKRSPSRLNLLARVMNLRLEQASYESIQEQNQYEIKWDRWNARGRQGPEPRLNTIRSNKVWNEVIIEAIQILREYPAGQGTDAVNFNLAMAYQFLGRNSESAGAFERLIKQYPRSGYVGDSYFFLGEYYFEISQFSSAINYFKRALSYKKSKRYGWALFKLGWAHFNLGEYTKALDSWKKTYKYSERIDNGQRLQDEALRDMVYAYAELKQVQQAINYYRSIGQSKYVPRLLQLLASTLTDQGRYTQGVIAWKRLIDFSPNSPEALEAQREIIGIYFDSNQYKKLWAELSILQTRYGSRSRWADKNPKLIRDALDRNKELTFYYPKKIHQLAQKNESNRLYREALAGYKLFLKFYSKSKELAEVKEYIGDIHFFNKNYRGAGEEYEDIVNLGKDNAQVFSKKSKPESNHFRSAKNMLDAYNRALNPELQRLLKIKPNFKGSPKRLSRDSKNFIRSCELFQRFYKADAKTLKNCDTFIAEIFYKSNDRMEAQKRMWVLASKYPDSKEGRQAAENLIPLHSNDKNSLAAIAAKLSVIPEYRKGRFGKKLTNLLSQIAVEEISQESDLSRRANLYEAQARKGGKEADILWNNAAVDHLKAGSIDKAIFAYSQIATNYPKSKAYKSSLLQLGKLYDKILEFNKASSYYLLFAKKFPKEKATPGALQRSCLILIAAESPKADKNCHNFAWRYKDAGKDAIFLLIKSHYRRKSYRKMILLVEQTLLKIRPDRNTQIVALKMVLDGYGKNSQEGKRAMQRIIRIAKKGNLEGQALRYAGEVYFQQALGRAQAVRKMRLRGGSVNNLQSSIQKISTSLEKTEAGFSRLFRLGDAFWGVAAFYELAQSYEHFADLMKNPPSIKGVKKSELVEQLQGSVSQVLAKSKELYNTGLSTARKFEVVNKYVPLTIDAMYLLRKSKVTTSDWVVKPDFLASEIVSKQLHNAIERL